MSDLGIKGQVGFLAEKRIGLRRQITIFLVLALNWIVSMALIRNCAHTLSKRFLPSDVYSVVHLKLALRRRTVRLTHQLFRPNRKLFVDGK